MYDWHTNYKLGGNNIYNVQFVGDTQSNVISPTQLVQTPVCTLHRAQADTHSVRAKHVSGQRHHSIGAM